MFEKLKKEKWRPRREMGKKQENNPDSEYGEWTSPVTSEAHRLNINVSMLTLASSYFKLILILNHVSLIYSQILDRKKSLFYHITTINS